MAVSNLRQVNEVEIPEGSLLARSLSRIDFGDAWQGNLSDNSLTPVELFLFASKAAPEWVDSLMKLRNKVVSYIGLKNVGALNGENTKSPGAYNIGDRIGIFNILDMNENELLMGIDDHHLDVRVSVLKVQQDGLSQYIVSTAVKIHNWLGHLYMLPVVRIHPLVVKAIMRRLVV